MWHHVINILLQFCCLLFVFAFYYILMSLWWVLRRQLNSSEYSLTLYRGRVTSSSRKVLAPLKCRKVLRSLRLFTCMSPMTSCCDELFGLLQTRRDQTAISATYDKAHAQSRVRAPRRRQEHPGARHECQVCGREFNHRGHLNRHLTTVHSSEGPRFECEVCGKKFTEKGNMKRHLATVHSTLAQCSEC